jgi:hypothetical protein
MIHLFSNLALVTLILLVLILIFTSLRTLIKKSLPLDSSISVASAVTMSANAIIATVVLVTYLFGHHPALMKISVLTIFVLTILLALGGFVFSTYSEKKTYFKLTLAGTLLSIWILFPALLLKSISSSGIGLISRGNHDNLFFASLANEFMKNGFNNTGHIFNYDLNYISSLVYFTPTSLIYYVATTFNIPTWKATTPVVLFGIFYSFTALIRLTRSLFPNLNQIKSSIIVSIVLTTSIISYIIAHMYIAQIYAIGIAASISANMIEHSNKRKNHTFLYLEFFALVTLAIYTYSVFLIPFLLFILCIRILFSFKTSKFGEAKTFFVYGVIISVNILMNKDYLQSSINGMLQMKTGEYGWNISSINPISILVFPELLTTDLPTFWPSILFISLILILLILMRVIPRENQLHRSVLLFCVLCIILTLAYIHISGGGLGKYQNWKLVSYFVPIVLTLILGLTMTYLRNSSTFLLILLGLALSNPIQIWGFTPKEGAIYASEDLEALTSQFDWESINGLNVDLSYADNIIIPTLVNSKVLFFNSESYYPKSESKNFCILVYNKDMRYESVRRLNQTYGLAPGIDGKC